MRVCCCSVGVLLKLVLLLFVTGSNCLGQVTTWVEDAENGLGNVLDFSSPDFDLIQTSIASQGAAAFHLGNYERPGGGFSDSWFEIDQTISVQESTNLFFNSQHGLATQDQRALVQLSTDAGATWPFGIYEQPGAGGSGFGEGAFSLKTVPLSDFAGQDVRVRFYYDFDSGTLFPQSDNLSVGWIIDDIQFAAEVNKPEYSIGNPSDEETLYLELINRSRADALEEANRLANTDDARLTGVYSFFGIDTDDIVDQYEWAIDSGCLDRVSQPLAFNEELQRMSELHSEDQRDNDFQGHTSSSDPPSPFLRGDGIGDRADRVGYAFTRISENAFTDAESPEFGHAAFEVDWGSTSNFASECYNSDFAGQGIQNPAGHRLNIHTAAMKEAGIGVVENAGDTHVVTQNFGSTGNATFATGVVYDDENENGFYDIGEGRGGVKIESESSAFTATSTDSGAYAIPITGDGTHQLSFTVPGMSAFETTFNVVNGDNVKVDFLLGATDMVLAGDFDSDGVLTAADIDALSAAIRLSTADPSFDLDGNGVLDEGDRSSWLSLRGSLLGDANFSGNVEFLDFLALANGFGQPSTGWAQGDFNGSGSTEFLDFLQMANNFGMSAAEAASPVPEPTGIFLLGIGLGTLLLGRRSRE